LKAGFITAGELFAARIDVKELDLARAELERRKTGLLQDLRGLCGMPELEFANLSLPTPSAGKLRVEMQDLPRAARSGSLDLAIVDALQEARTLGLRLSKASHPLRPSLALRAELAYEGGAFPLLEDGWTETDDWQLTLSIASTVTLFDGGAARAASARAAAELDMAQAQAGHAHAELDAFVQASIQALALARARLEYDSLRLQSQSESLKSLRQELLAGAGTESEYLRGLLEALSTVTDGWTRLLEHRTALWSLEALLPPP